VSHPRRRETNMSISQALLPEFDEEMANTRKILAIVPEDKFDYKPHEKSMKLGRLAGHVAEMPAWGRHTLEVEVLEIEAGQKGYEPESRQAMLEKFDNDVASAREKLAAVTDEDMAKTWTLKYGGNDLFSMPRTAVWRGMVMNHMVHHRGQLGVYLRLVEVEIPGMYGPSADEMKAWSAQT
jgi:uncharacterized damage-inducible protein DinB